MGEPSFNPAVLRVLRDLPRLYDMPGFIPSLSTIAPRGTQAFFNELLAIKKELYTSTFQLQFSIHSTKKAQRDQLIPVRKWEFHEIVAYGKQFFDPGGRKITLNFALSQSTVLEPAVMIKHFSPEIFIIKLTPVNPTFKAAKNKLQSLITEERPGTELKDKLEALGYEVILSIGEWEENQIGSNCGQYIEACRKSTDKLDKAYQSELT